MAQAVVSANCGYSDRLRLLQQAVPLLMELRELPAAHAHHLMVEAIRSNVLPRSRLPKVVDVWEERLIGIGLLLLPMCRVLQE